MLICTHVCTCMFVQVEDDAATECFLASLAVHGATLFSSSTGTGKIRVWNAAHDCIATLEGHTASVLALAIGGGKLFSGSFDKTIRVWDATTHAHLTTLEGHTAAVSALTVSDSQVFSSGGDTICVWDVSTHRHLITLEGQIPAHSLAVCDKKLFHGSCEGSIDVLDLGSSNVLASLEHEYWDGVVSLVISGSKLFTAGGILGWQAVRKKLRINGTGMQAPVRECVALNTGGLQVWCVNSYTLLASIPVPGTHGMLVPPTDRPTVFMYTCLHEHIYMYAYRILECSGSQRLQTDLRKFG